MIDTSSYRKSLAKTSCFGDSARASDRFSSQRRCLALGLASETGEEKRHGYFADAPFHVYGRLGSLPLPKIYSIDLKITVGQRYPHIANLYSQKHP